MSAGGLTVDTRRQYDDEDGLLHDGQNDGEPDDGLSSNQDFDDEDEDDMSSPSVPDENIDFDQVYALHTFVATVEGQASVVKGDTLTLLDDSNSYWWLVRVLKTGDIGYIPAENIETPWERLARLNKHRNVDVTSVQNAVNLPDPPRTLLTPKKNVIISKSISFHAPIILQFDDDDEEPEEDFEEWDEDMEDYEDSDEDNMDGVDGKEKNDDQVVPDNNTPLIIQSLEDDMLSGTTTKFSLTPSILRDSNDSLDGSTDDLLGRRGQRNSGSWPAGSTPPHKPRKVLDADPPPREPFKESSEKKKKGLKGFFSRNKKEKPTVEKKITKKTQFLTPDNDSSSNSFDSKSSDSFDSARGDSFDNQRQNSKEKEKDKDKDQNTQLTVLRIFAGNVHLGATFKTCMVNESTTASELVKQAMGRFHIQEIEGGPTGEENSGVEYFITVKNINEREEYTLAPSDHPLTIFQTLTAHLNTPLPSTTHIKRLSAQPATVEVTRVGVAGAKRNSNDGHFGEDSVIKFFLHKKIKRVDEREGKIYIKVCLFSNEVINGFNGMAQSNAAKGSKKAQPGPQECISKLISVKPHETVAEVTALALDKFHILNAIVDGDGDEEEKKKALRLSSDGMDQQERIVKYCLMVAHAGNERALHPKEKINSAFRSSHTPQMRVSNRISDTASVTSGSSTASNPRPDEVYFILRRTDKDMDTEWERQQGSEASQQQSSQSGNGESSLWQDRAQQLQQPRSQLPSQMQQGTPKGSLLRSTSIQSSTDSNLLGPKMSSVDDVRNMLATSSSRKEDLTKVGRGLSPDRHGASSGPNQTTANNGGAFGNQSRSQVLKMLNSEEAISDDSDRAESPDDTARGQPTRAPGQGAPSQGGPNQRPPPQDVLSKLDEALQGLEKERSAPAPAPVTAPAPRSRPRPESPVIPSGALSAVRNEEDGIDLVLPGRSGLLRSSRLMDQKVRYSFISPEGTEMEISNIIEDILGNFGSSSSLFDGSNSGLLPLGSGAKSEGVKKSESPAQNPNPNVEKSVESTSSPMNPKSSGSADSDPKTKKAPAPKTDYLESYVDQAKSSNMKPETMERLEKVLKKVKEGGGKKKERKDKGDKSDKSDKEKGDRSTPSPVDTRVRSPADRTKSPSRNARPKEESVTSPTTPTGTGPRPGSAESSSSRPVTPRDYQSSQQQRQTNASPASISSVSTDSTKATSLTPSPNPPTPTGGNRPHDSMIFTEDFGLDEMMTLVRGGISFLEAKEKMKNGWEDESKRGSVNSLHQVDAQAQKGSVREKDVEVRQDVKDVFREPLATLDNLEQELDVIMTDALRVF